MYIPGRRRTGSRPSRTVMSFAEYEALAMAFPITKKSCKTTVLQGVESVSERAVFGGPSEAQTDRLLHTFAEPLVVDRGGNFRRSPRLLRRRHNGRSRNGHDLLGR